MQTSVTFKNIDSSDHLKSFIQDKLNRLDKLLDNPAEANVVLSVEKFRHIAEISLIGDRLNIVGKEETNDMYSAIDMVLDKLETQLKKNKQKMKKRRPVSRKKNKGFEPPL
ncbi:MAG: ribosome-associated translation inhibitor RaiA, partial [Deltaproteobacteria bacterium]